VLDRKHFSGAAHPALDLVGHEEDAVVAADFRQFLKVAGRRRDEPALPLNRFGHDTRHRLGVHVHDEEILELLRSDHVAEGHAVDLGRKGAEA
jgi:hypothetical protein